MDQRTLRRSLGAVGEGLAVTPGSSVTRGQAMKPRRPAVTLRRSLGAVGEGLASAHLTARGYEIAGRNVRLPEGEIDIIALRDRTTVIVEVRARRGRRMGDGLDSIDARKAARLRDLAASYAALHDIQGGIRIDVIAVDLAPDGRLLGLRHIENAVEG